MADLDTREWLLTNGLGFLQVVRARMPALTYHGWLICLDPESRTLAAPGCQLGVAGLL